MGDIDPDCQNELRSNVNLRIENQHVTFYLLPVAMLAQSVTVYEILTVKMCVTLTASFRMWPMLNINMSVSRGYYRLVRPLGFRFQVVSVFRPAGFLLQVASGHVQAGSLLQVVSGHV